MQRRRWLRGALTTVGLVGAGGVGALAALRGRAPAVAGLRFLDAQGYRTLRALAEAALPRGGAFPFGAADTDLARAFDAFLADEPRERQAELATALLLLEYGPLLFDGRAVTFSHLSEAERLRHFETWATSEDLLRRKVSVGLRKFLLVVFYDRPEVWPALGYSLPGAP
ncbi:MAG: hypothetical protein IT376_06030 [Polyangiaceae bacterium]|nr:hypothetical protein [Polyangiaceae bacterium]